MTTEQYETVLEEIRRKSVKLNAYIAYGTAGSLRRAQEVAAEICCLAANAKQQSEMEREQSDLDSLDLSHMPAPSFVSDAE